MLMIQTLKHNSTVKLLLLSSKFKTADVIVRKSQFTIKVNSENLGLLKNMAIIIEK